jgi:hypothetical protein
MVVIFLFLLAFAIGEIVLLVLMAQSEPLDMVGQALHPFNVMGFLFLVTIVDFVSLYQIVAAGQGAEFAGTMISYTSDVVKGFAFYVFCQTAMVLGMWLATRYIDRPTRIGIRVRRGRPVVSTPAEIGAARISIVICVIASIFAGWSILVVSLQHGSLNYVAGIRTKFFADNPMLQVIVSTAAPAFILFGSRDRMRPVIIAMPVLMLFLALVGGRSKLLYPVIAAAYWFCRSRRLSVLWVYLLTPILIVLLVYYTYVARQSQLYASFQQYLDASGGMFGALFDEPSISMAEAITLNVNNPILHRAPWDSIVGMLMLPVPRSLVPWKPLGVSTDFSMAADYTRWTLVKSEWTVTGFINLYYEIGYIGALVGCGALAFFWTRQLIRSASSSRGTAFAGPIAIIIAYQFIRGDLYIVSQFLWPTGIVMLIYLGLKGIVRLFPGSAPRARRPNRLGRGAAPAMKG